MGAAANFQRFRPRKPQTIEETGLSFNLVFDLVLKHAYFEGTVTLARLAQRTRLHPVIIHSLYRQMQKEHLCETRTMIQDDYEIFLTQRGREMAELAMRKSQYAGPVPVPLADYNQSVSAQAIAIRTTAEDLKSDLSDLVVPADLIQQLGTALVTGGAILLYGSTGNGKTSIAERLHRLWAGSIYVPYAVEIAGHIVTVYDPLIHRSDSNTSDDEYIPWVLCRRPMVKVGGELHTDMLDPRVDETTRIGVAPVQMKANNGILFVDDFGRQRITPRELLNRWIVPLDRHRDMLSLSTGVSFEIPFEVLVVFATNLSLSDLAEDAFMRRLKNKIKVEPLEADLFKELLRRVCASQSMTCSPEVEDLIIEQCRQHSKDGLRACFPIDLVSLVAGMAKFEQRVPVLQKAEVEQALKLYFVH